MTDVLLEIAVANWGPRFTANGVDASDYQRITGPLEHWNDWCAAWCVGAGRTALMLGDEALKDGRHRSAGEYFARAATYFHFGKFMFVHDMDQAKDAHERAVEALNRATPLFVPPGSRHEIAFEGSTLVGLFRQPSGPGPHPTVLLIPGLDSTKEEFREVERAFHDRGMATFALDGPGQGEAEWTLPIRPEWEVVGETVISYLQSMPSTSIPERIGVWGVSPRRFLRRAPRERGYANPSVDRARRSLQLGRHLEGFEPSHPSRFRSSLVFLVPRSGRAPSVGHDAGGFRGEDLNADHGHHAESAIDSSPGRTENVS